MLRFLIFIGRVLYNVKSVIITTAVPSSPPQNVTVTSVDPASLMVTWEPPPLIDQNGPIVSYAISIMSIEHRDIRNVTIVGTELTISDLIPFVNYSVQVAASNTNGTGVFSTIMSQVSGEDSKFQQVYINK